MKWENMNLSSVQCGVLKEVWEIFGGGKKNDDDNESQRSIMTPVDITRIFKLTSSLPFSADFESLRGWCFEQIHKNDLALYIYDEILDKSPLHGVTLRRKGQLLAKMGREDESGDLYDLAILLEPDNLHLELLREDSREYFDDSNPKQGDDAESQSDDTSKWVIRIKSIEPPKITARTRSVVFKNEVIEEPTKKEKEKEKENVPIQFSFMPKTKSILKTKSQLFQPTKPPKYDETTQTKSAFDISKIKSIDGKLSSFGGDTPKSMLMAIDSSNKSPFSRQVSFLGRKTSQIMEEKEENA